MSSLSSTLPSVRREISSSANGIAPFAQGAVVGTSNGAVQRGYKAVVPVDGMSSESAFNELYAAWHIAKGGPANLVNNATLTRSDLIKFSD